ncbi:DUF2207 domain-containing protein [Chitinophaga sedimenti]|uniref:DUF2207 family protein n=1 Tax=Chitinophaga sedimenti TaxID=2033606 RepID=UPI0020052BF1|nr:DUF2207 domain-containing protein [Chitinophaga sedimenti]MCK7554305.1 DUF2207 domain-containing protein [Chitinophaga sedimenti]
MWTGALVTMAVLALYLLAINWKSLLLLAFITPFLAIGVTVFISGIRSFRESGCAAFFMIAFGGVFTAVPGFMFLMMATELPFIAILFVITVVTMFGFYLWLIPAPTEIGAELKAEIEGFKEYLSVAEEHRLNILTPPEHTPELFERMLPYAIALEVENEWGRKFKDLLESIDYMPDWYGGRSFAYGRIGDTFSDRFATTVQKSSAPVRSSSGSSGWSGRSSSGSSSWSSGSSGGGSSGGGGGGGGGGGW